MVPGPRTLWVFLSWADESQQLSELTGGGYCVGRGRVAGPQRAARPPDWAFSGSQAALSCLALWPWDRWSFPLA